MAYTAILQRIRLLIPEEMDGYYKAIVRGFEDGVFRDHSNQRVKLKIRPSGT